MIVISFPGGSGGNWLRSVIEKEPMVGNLTHFHQHNQTPVVSIIHELDVSKFQYLLSGDYYFNFFVNVIYKCFYKDLQFTESRNYKDYYTECVNTARYLCQFDRIKDHTYFNFNDLIDNDQQFYRNITLAFPNLNLTYADFVARKNLFFETMVETQNLYENFDEPIWVSFVLGQLMNHNIVPADFSIYEKENQQLSAEFARQNYHYCKLRQVHHFKTNVFLPNLL